MVLVASMGFNLAVALPPIARDIVSELSEFSIWASPITVESCMSPLASCIFGVCAVVLMNREASGVGCCGAVLADCSVSYGGDDSPCKC